MTRTGIFTLILVSLSQLVSATIVQEDISIPRAGNLRYFYDDSMKNACDNLVLVGVGTAMTTSAYDLLSTEMVTGHPIVAIVIDHAPNWFIKTSETRYANLANSIVNDLQDILQICNATTKKIILGGHSASGQAAWNSMRYLTFNPDGFLGLDPFQMDSQKDNDMILPTLNFGFKETTCRVTVSQAAKAAFQASDDRTRVFYQVDNSDQTSLGHCSFTDQGCFGVICPAAQGSDSVRRAVGSSLSTFVQSLYTQEYDRALYMVQNSQVSIDLYLNKDQVSEALRVPERRLRGRTAMAY